MGDATPTTAKQRAAARREAILNSRGNRLSKLTSSARGDEAALLYADSSPQPSRVSPAPDFLGEQSSNMPRPASTSPSPAPGRQRPARHPATHEAEPAIDQQQEEMMRAIFQQMAQGGGLPSIAPGLTPPGINTPSTQPPPSGDPFAMMLAQMAGQSNQAGPGSLLNPLAGANAPPHPMMQALQPPPPKTMFQKLAPLLHAISGICLVFYFVFQFEPGVYSGKTGDDRPWDRWASLARYANDGRGVQAVPLFYAFTTLQVILHSIRIYYEPSPPPPSGILGLLASGLPHPFPLYITTALKYVQMSSAVLDDLCVLLFAVGLVVWGAGLVR